MPVDDGTSNGFARLPLDFRIFHPLAIPVRPLSSSTPVKIYGTCQIERVTLEFFVKSPRALIQISVARSFCNLSQAF